ncbi:hypothetical protein Pcinc_024814 [Petrolisthes cinctipes]|uniref:Uncharacterized protein n=1 Tax=Petrolisthes cinctipes TaxID=88211 RepID=A0AAE1FAH5_PETCI|nr:hypothetical protein Pcinc_024814 [Petrolisthes cinctipes]
MVVVVVVMVVEEMVVVVEVEEEEESVVEVEESRVGGGDGGGGGSNGGGGIRVDCNRLTCIYSVLQVLMQSLCSEMAEELRFAMKCHGSRQRPALKRNCSRCTPGTTYVPATTDLPQANGVSAFFVSPSSCSSLRHHSRPANTTEAVDTCSLPADLTPPPPPPFPYPAVVPSYGISRLSTDSSYSLFYSPSSHNKSTTSIASSLNPITTTLLQHTTLCLLIATTLFQHSTSISLQHSTTLPSPPPPPPQHNINTPSHHLHHSPTSLPPPQQHNTNTTPHHLLHHYPTSLPPPPPPQHNTNTHSHHLLHHYHHHNITPTLPHITFTTPPPSPPLPHNTIQSFLLHHLSTTTQSNTHTHLGILIYSFITPSMATGKVCVVAKAVPPTLCPTNNNNNNTANPFNVSDTTRPIPSTSHQPLGPFLLRLTNHLTHLFYVSPTTRPIPSTSHQPPYPSLLRLTNHLTHPFYVSPTTLPIPSTSHQPPEPSLLCHNAQLLSAPSLHSQASYYYYYYYYFYLSSPNAERPCFG